ncbi:hypothetical protein L0P88_04385 [Muricauda sp. SCSIO 64092]|uniref:hypothetical protein n=1 Tax=Allomuricauda sp. SCSIO 64092 TaxID=2908842 RepID=UPI001FF52445|nr:hypothetical protein [Muricauda sp. SCSIO 64092]UOY07792.1 hypothetical protein L0P88_04385 [Muricauda sp. SCSIO 64092]
MRNFSFLPIVLLLFGNLTLGQDNSISEFDLYGCWIMERFTQENEPNKRVYISCGISDKQNTVKNSGIVFRAYNKCVFPVLIQDAICPILYKSVEGTWTYDKESGIVEVFYPKDFKKGFWDAVNKEQSELEIRNPRMKMKFKIVGLENGKLEIEKVTPDMVYN